MKKNCIIILFFIFLGNLTQATAQQYKILNIKGVASKKGKILQKGDLLKPQDEITFGSPKDMIRLETSNLSRFDVVSTSKKNNVIPTYNANSPTLFESTSQTSSKLKPASVRSSPMPTNDKKKKEKIKTEIDEQYFALNVEYLPDFQQFIANSEISFEKETANETLFFYQANPFLCLEPLQFNLDGKLKTTPNTRYAIKIQYKDKLNDLPKDSTFWVENDILFRYPKQTSESLVIDKSIFKIKDIALDTAQIKGIELVVCDTKTKEIVKTINEFKPIFITNEKIFIEEIRQEINYYKKNHQNKNTAESTKNFIKSYLERYYAPILQDQFDNFMQRNFNL